MFDLILEYCRLCSAIEDCSAALKMIVKFTNVPGQLWTITWSPVWEDYRAQRDYLFDRAFEVHKAILTKMAEVPHAEHEKYYTYQETLRSVTWKV